MMTLLLAAIVLAAPAERPDLTGKIFDSTGNPVAGANVFIDTAKKRVGVNVLCPSCYADCGKSATTHSDGGFSIGGLDPSLLFRVLVVRDGFQPTFVEQVDPARGSIKATLKPIPAMQLEPGYAVRGRLVDAKRKPVIGAEITTLEFKTEAHWGYREDIVDPLAVSNLNGEFVLTSKSRVESVTVKVVARGLAPTIFSRIPPTDRIRELRLGVGATVSGRIIRDHKPLPGIVVGLVQQSRSARTFLGPAQIATDANGRFLFSNVGPNDQYYLYGIMESLKPFGSVPAVPLNVGGDEITLDAGDLRVVPGHRVSGRIILSDGKVVPAHTRVGMFRDLGWDRQIVEADSQGRFLFEGLPTERYRLACLVKGYRLSEKNHSANPGIPAQMEGRIERDIDDLTLLYEPSQGRPARVDSRSPDHRKAIEAFRIRRMELMQGVDPALYPSSAKR
jgi:Carboxypeptidase regulatory-like domain